MLQFLQPLGLLAILGIVLPIAIHLWNKREGKTLKIGSVLLLSETARQQARSFRLKDLLLLLLRCLVITLLAVLLARPIWQKQLNPNEKKGWVVLDPQSVKAHATYQRILDSLLTAGFEAHLFTSGFPLVKLDHTLSQNLPIDTLPYWTLLKALNEQVPAQLPVYLFTSNHLYHFSGDRPLINMNLKWQAYTSADTATATGNLVAARLLERDSIKTVVAQSTIATAAYTTESISLLNPKPAYKLQQSNKGYQLSLATDTSTVVAVDTAVLRIAIYTDQYFSDVKYLQAAIHAIQQYGRYRIEIATITDLNKLPAQCNWLFWLSQKEVPVSLMKNNVFAYATGKEKAVQTRLITDQRNTPGGEEIALFKSIVSAHTNAVAKVIWSNGYGEPVLSKEQSANTIFHFYSRFDPAWNGLVWSEQFPQLLFELLINRKSYKNQKDNRSIDGNQMEPVPVATGTLQLKQKFVETTDLLKWAWGFAFILFALERVISLKQQKEANA